MSICSIRIRIEGDICFLKGCPFLSSSSASLLPSMSPSGSAAPVRKAKIRFEDVSSSGPVDTFNRCTMSLVLNDGPSKGGAHIRKKHTLGAFGC